MAGKENRQHLPDTGCTTKNSKRKDREEDNDEGVQEPLLKRRVADEEEELRGGTINEVLPPEVMAIILRFAGQNAPKTMWVIGRLVCWAWYNFFPSSDEYRKQFKQKKGSFSLFGRCVPFELAEHGWVELLRWAHTVFPRCRYSSQEAAAQFGLVDYLKELLCDTTMCWGRVSSKAAKGGQLEVLKWQLGLGLKFSAKPLCKAVLQAHLEIAKWLATIISPDNSLAWSTMAASRSQLEMLKWLVTQKWAWPYRNEWTCVAAAQGGHLETLKWLKKRDGRLNEWVCWTAARNGHLEVLKWALANGASWDLQSCTSEYFNCLKRIGVGKESIAQSGHLDVLKFAIDCGGVFHPKTCEDAARGGYLDILKWARENGCSWDGAICAAAALGGHLEILKWARENGAPWDYRTL